MLIISACIHMCYYLFNIRCFHFFLHPLFASIYSFLHPLFVSIRFFFFLYGFIPFPLYFVHTSLCFTVHVPILLTSLRGFPMVLHILMLLYLLSDGSSQILQDFVWLIFPFSYQILLVFWRLFVSVITLKNYMSDSLIFLSWILYFLHIKSLLLYASAERYFTMFLAVFTFEELHTILISIPELNSMLPHGLTWFRAFKCWKIYKDFQMPVSTMQDFYILAMLSLFMQVSYGSSYVF